MPGPMLQYSIAVKQTLQLTCTQTWSERLSQPNDKLNTRQQPCHRIQDDTLTKHSVVVTGGAHRHRQLAGFKIECGCDRQRYKQDVMAALHFFNVTCMAKVVHTFSFALLLRKHEKAATKEGPQGPSLRSSRHGQARACSTF